MSTRAAGKKVHTGYPPGRKQYDKELVRHRTLELLTLRLGGPGKDQGARLVWDCPGCGKREKYSVKKMEGKGGCLVEGCRLSGYDDVFGMLAKLEDLDYHADFLAILANAYDLLGLEPARARAEAPTTIATPKQGVGRLATSVTSRGATPQTVAIPQRVEDSANSGPRSGAKTSSKDLDALLIFAARVYERILELCPLETRDRRYLRTRGLSYETIRRGRFATMTTPRARQIKATLQREFGREELLFVPGFSEDEEDGHLKFTLSGDYVLIPYHDPRGRVTTIEGRGAGEHEGPRKYVTLRRAGNHLYLFPGHRPENLLAVCEGAMGAIVAAEFGMPVGAIQGCERFRASPSLEVLDGAPGDPLLELKDTDFAGRIVPYIPDADHPPNLNVLKAAPKAARWIAEPQNGRAAICLLPKGADLDEWLLSLPPEERAARFADLLAGASSPEDGIRLSPDTTTGGHRSGASPDRRSPEGTDDASATAGHTAPRDKAPPQPEPGARPGPRGGMTKRSSPVDADRERTPKKGKRVPTAEDAASRTAPASAPRKRKAKAGERLGHGDHGSPTPQPGLWDEGFPPVPNVDTESGRDDHDNRRGVSRGARKLRDEVYRTMIEVLPPKEEHLEALAKRGVMHATARVGRFASLDEGRAKGMATNLTERFGAKKLLSVPGFEPDGAGKVRLTLASSGAEEHVLVPCFDAEGLLSGVEALAFDQEAGEIDVEQTVPLKGAGSHLYVFAHYASGQVEGFCEGPLGAMLAAQEDVVIGAIGGFRRHKAASGPAEGRQPVDAVLPELKGVDFDGRSVAYVPRTGAAIGEPNARYHEAVTAARYLVERQNGRAVVVGLRGDSELGEDDGGPTSLGEWILSLPEDEAQDRLRKLFPESPARDAVTQESERYVEETDHDEEDVPPPLPTKMVYGALALATVAAVFLDALLLRLEAFAGYVSVGPGGEQILYAGTSGPLRRLADSPPFNVLYDLHVLVALVAGLALTLVLIARARRGHLARWKATRMRLEESWKLHLTPGKTTPSRVPVTPEEALSAVLTWPVAFVLTGWIITASEALLLLATRLRMVPEIGTLVADPTLAAIYAATLFSAFVLWRRRSIRAAEARMLQGEIRH